MVRLWYSNHLERLVDSLVEQIQAERQASDPFEPVRIVVPNRTGVFTRDEFVRVGRDT